MEVMNCMMGASSLIILSPPGQPRQLPGVTGIPNDPLSLTREFITTGAVCGAGAPVVHTRGATVVCVLYAVWPVGPGCRKQVLSLSPELIQNLTLLSTLAHTVYHSVSTKSKCVFLNVLSCFLHMVRYNVI